METKETPSGHAGVEGGVWQGYAVTLLGTHSNTDVLIEAVDHSDSPVRMAALTALGGTVPLQGPFRSDLEGHAHQALTSTNYNVSFGGDPMPGYVKQLKIQYRINGKEGEASFAENSLIILPHPK